MTTHNMLRVVNSYNEKHRYFIDGKRVPRRAYYEMLNCSLRTDTMQTSMKRIDNERYQTRYYQTTYL